MIDEIPLGHQFYGRAAELHGRDRVRSLKIRADLLKICSVHV